LAAEDPFVTEHSSALVAQLREREQQLRFALQGGDLGLWDWNFVTGALAVNDRWCTMLGIDPAGPAPTIATWHAAVHPDDVSRLDQIVHDVLLNPRGEGFETEVRARHADGRWIWILDKGAVVARDGQGAPLRVVGTHLEITARKHAELSRRRAEERLRFALDAAGIAEWEVDCATGQLRLSPTAEALLGRAVADGGSMAALLDAVDPADRRGASQAWDGVRSGATDLEVEFRIADGSGASRWLWLKGTARTTDGTAGRTLEGILVDVTRRRMAEEERASLQRAVLDAASFEQQRIGMDLHDGLGQQLTGVSLMLAALARHPPDDPVQLRERLERLARDASQCVRQARAIAHGLAPLDVESKGLDAALRRLVESMEDAAGLRTELRVEGAEHIDAGDAVNVYRIVQEALANAVKHGRARHAIVCLRAAPDSFVASVEDDGIGVASRADAPSSGLGLKIMAYRAHLLRGALDIDKRAEGGTIVRLSRPATAPRRTGER
jgi:PAS domain S-box-containing protein